MKFLSNIGGALSGLFGGSASLVGKGLGPLVRGGEQAISNIGPSLGNFSRSMGQNLMNSLGFGHSTPLKSTRFGPDMGLTALSARTPFSSMSAGIGGGLPLGGGAFDLASTLNAAKTPTRYGVKESTKSRGGSGIWNTLKDFGGSKYFGPTAGLAGLFGSQLIQNPKVPALPPAYNEYMNMMKGGGTPGMQSAQNYYMNVLSGQDKNAYNAVTEGIDQAYEQELDNLRAAYRNARPGSDITTDSAFKRDEAELSQRYAQRKAMAMASVQQAAASGLGGLGAQQMGGMQAGIGPAIDQNNLALQMAYDKTSGFRNALAGLGSQMFSGPMQMKILQQMFGG